MRQIRTRLQGLEKKIGPCGRCIVYQGPCDAEEEEGQRFINAAVADINGQDLIVFIRDLRKPPRPFELIRVSRIQR